MQQPNQLWIVTTQWRAQATGYAGDPNARTPALDGLARQSINFRQAVTPHPFGPFARAALLTGVLSPENGVRDYYDPLPSSAVTIAHRLGALGYATAFFGDWHLGRRDPATPPVGETNARIIVPPAEHGGFEFWEGFESGFQLNNPWLHGTRLTEPTQFKGYQSDVICGRAADWILNTGTRTRAPASGAPTWFVVVSLEAPHPPYDAPAAGIAPTDPAGVVLAANVPRGGEVEAKARKELAGYYAHIEATDRAIGRLVAGVPEDTAVVFTSVHGDMHGAHGLFRKGWPHEESIRVPLLVRVPPGCHVLRDVTVLPGGVSDAAISLLDLSALTVAIATGGEFRVPTEAAISMPSVVDREHQCDRVWRGTRSAGRKCVFNADGTPWLGVV